MPQKQPQPGSMLMASQQILWHGHRRKARVQTCLQSGGKRTTHPVKFVFTTQDSKCKGQIAGPVEINGRDLIGLGIQSKSFGLSDCVWNCHSREVSA